MSGRSAKGLTKLIESRSQCVRLWQHCRWGIACESNINWSSPGKYKNSGIQGCKKSSLYRVLRDKATAGKAGPLRKGILLELLNDLLPACSEQPLWKMSTALVSKNLFYQNSVTLNMTFKQKNSKCRAISPSSKYEIRGRICYLWKQL